MSVSATKNSLRPLEVCRHLQNGMYHAKLGHDFEPSEVDFGKILAGPVLTAPFCFFYAS